MTRQPVTLDTLPLYADDMAIGEAVLGPKRAKEWVQMTPLLEAKGLPKIDAWHGGRCVPLVKRYYYALNGIEPGVPLAPDGVENPEIWKRKGQRRQA